MSTLTNGDLQLIKPDIGDIIRNTINNDLPSNFDKIDSEHTILSGRVDTIITTPTTAVTVEEIVDARDGETTLHNKLDLIENKADIGVVTNDIILDTTGYGVISGLIVIQHAVPDMSVDVQVGVAHLSNGGRIETTGLTNVAVGVSDATYARKDIIYITSDGIISYLQGVATATPVIPTLPTGGIPLAILNVVANAASIVTSNITDNRIMKSTFTGYNTSVSIINDRLNTDESNISTLTSSVATNTANISQLSNYNYCINGNFDFWQRGTSFNNLYQLYSADRWYCTRTGTGASSISKVGNSMSITTTEIIYINQFIENSVSLKDDIMTFSIYVDGVIYIATGKPSDNISITTPKGNISLGFSTTRNVIAVGVMLTTGAILTKAKLELGDKATPFAPRRYGDELALCRRYYEKGDYAQVMHNVTGNHSANINYSVVKRSQPSVVVTVASSTNFVNPVLTVGSTIPLYGNSVCSFSPFVTIITSGATQYTATWTSDAEIY